MGKNLGDSRCIVLWMDRKNGPLCPQGCPLIHKALLSPGKSGCRPKENGCPVWGICLSPPAILQWEEEKEDRAAQKNRSLSTEKGRWLWIDLWMGGSAAPLQRHFGKSIALWWKCEWKFSFYEKDAKLPDNRFFFSSWRQYFVRNRTKNLNEELHI